MQKILKSILPKKESHTMVIEILFGELCNFFGDSQNEVYLRETLKDTNSVFISTELDSVPYFVSGRPDLVIMGSMSEKAQRIVIKKLSPYKDRINSLIDSGTGFLMTGNACEVFCKNIDYVTEKIKVDGLGLFDLEVKTDLFRRINGKIIGDFEGNTITGFRSQFSYIYGDNTDSYFVNVERGFGINPDSRFEGFRRNNFIGTQILGPILPLNPDFCRYYLGLLGTDSIPAFYNEALEAFDRRVSEFRDTKTKF